MQNRTKFNADELLESLKKYEFLSEKVFYDDGWIIIIFHKYLTVKICDDMFEFFDTHCHPASNEEILQIVEELLNEKIVFYHKYKFHYWQQRYSRNNLPMLLENKDKKNRRVYSAIKIYIDN